MILANPTYKATDHAFLGTRDLNVLKCVSMWTYGVSIATLVLHKDCVRCT